jgi:SAM-dependent methyltransferase
MGPEQFDLHRQIELTHWWFLARREIMCRIVQAIVPQGQGRLVIDVGCGTGANIAALGEDYDCVGIDTSSQGIELARQRFERIRFIEGQAPDDLGDLAVRADVFLVMDVLEHVRDEFFMFSKLLRAVRPGAYVLITVPADLRLWSPHDESFGHYRRYDSHRFREIWRGLPVEERLVSYFNSRLYPAVRLARSIARWRGRAVGAADTDFSLPWRPVNSLLSRVFAGEGDRLLRELDGRGSDPGHGVSLVALLRRTPEEVVPRSKPPHLAPDYWDPQRQRRSSKSRSVV